MLLLRTSPRSQWFWLGRVSQRSRFWGMFP